MKKILTLTILASALTISAWATEEESQPAIAAELPEVVELPDPQAQPEKPKKVFSDLKLSGFVVANYTATLKDDDNSNTFNLRQVRLSVGGRVVEDFEYKFQFQFNGNTTNLGDAPRLLDAYIEWQKIKEFKIKLGQFKRPFTFENPMNPIDQGFMGYSQAVQKLSGYSDRTGEHSSNGRDIGIQVQGDLFPNANGRRVLHYQIGVFNGQGINMKDVDNQKDVIGGVWVSPLKSLRIGVFGWVGSYARDGEWTDDNGDTQSGVRSVGRHRYAISGEYSDGDWLLRSEYIHSVGGSFSTTHKDDDDASDATLNTSNGTRADAFYVAGWAPIVPKKLRFKLRYDLYRKAASWSSAKTQWEAGLNFLYNKNWEWHFEYALINDRTLTKHNYSQIYTQISWRF